MLNVGNAVLIRTVTLYHVGRIVNVDEKFITLDDASWVADTGRFSNALKTGELTETELFLNPVMVAIAAIVDITSWPHPLPTATK